MYTNKSNKIKKNDTATIIRKKLIAALPSYNNPGPTDAGTVYVWPTKYCTAWCEHCNFASPLPRRPIKVTDAFHTKYAQDKLISFVNQLGMWKAVLSGGGEPFLEKNTVFRFVRDVQSDKLEEIELITNCFWAKNKSSTYRVLDKLYNSYCRRKTPTNPILTLRLSVDWFHRRRIGLEPIINVIKAWESEQYTNLKCYIRSVLIDNDDTINDLANYLNAEVTPIYDYQQEIILPNCRRLLVYFKNLVIDGRLSRVSFTQYPVKLSTLGKIDHFATRFFNSSGRYIPGLTYNGPCVRHDSLSLCIENDGTVKILEATSPDNTANLYQNNWIEARNRFYSDPLTIYLLEEGPTAFFKLMSSFLKNTHCFCDSSNKLYYHIDRLLSTSVARLWATVTIFKIAEKKMIELNLLIIYWSLLCVIYKISQKNNYD